MIENSANNRKLNLGCGKSYKEGWVNLDSVQRVKPDICHDLNRFPYPFEDSYFDEILCQDILEHLDDIVKVMEEIYRISKPQAQISIIVPHYSCVNAYSDPTHKRFFGYRSFDYFSGANQWDFYTEARFKIIKIKIKFFGKYKNWMWQKIADQWPRFYEEHLAWIAPAWFVQYQLETVKSSAG